ncbi:MAG: SLC13 family permease [Anaerolineales bacterium]|nr:SLC13 family permease [Anaerolineales bacterium]MCB0013025.1 SLC13 family permease [Anaerolineales bacterium]
MTSAIGLVLLILLGAIVLFASGRVRVDLVALLTLLALLLTDLVSVNEAFAGFSNPAVITVLAIYIVSDGLTRTGVADYVAQYLFRIAGRNELGLIAVLMLAVGAMSAFTNNIGATAVLMPAALSVGKRTGIAPSKLLIPLAFGSLLGGTTTLVGTPPNLLASAALEEAGFAPFSLLEYTPIGLLIFATGLVYMLLVGRHLLPSRNADEDDEHWVQRFQLAGMLHELLVVPDSALLGRTFADSMLASHFQVEILGALRQGRLSLGFMPNFHIEAGDRLFVKGLAPNVTQAAQLLGCQRTADLQLSDKDLTTNEAGLGRVVIGQTSDLIGQTVRGAEFRTRFGLQVMGIWHEGRPLAAGVADIPLHLGDTLLLLGRRDALEHLREEPSFVVLGNPAGDPRRLNRAPVAIIIFLVMISLVLAGVLPIAVAALIGAVMSVLTGCLTMDEAYQAIQWKSLFLIIGMLPLAVAMATTGAADYLAELVVGAFGTLGPRGVLFGIMLLAALLTPFMSNAAATLLVVPIAVLTAQRLSLDVRTFAMAVALAASSSLMFPLGHQANILVFSPGGYRFFDYTRVGLPLTLLIWLVLLLFLPLFMPF